jgi:hypothetical protein
MSGRSFWKALTGALPYITESREGDYSISGYLEHWFTEELRSNLLSALEEEYGRLSLGHILVTSPALLVHSLIVAILLEGLSRTTHTGRGNTATHICHIFNSTSKAYSLLPTHSWERLFGMEKDTFKKAFSRNAWVSLRLSWVGFEPVDNYHWIRSFYDLITKQFMDLMGRSFRSMSAYCISEVAGGLDLPSVLMVDLDLPKGGKMPSKMELAANTKQAVSLLIAFGIEHGRADPHVESFYSLVSGGIHLLLKNTVWQRTSDADMKFVRYFASTFGSLISTTFKNTPFPYSLDLNLYNQVHGLRMPLMQSANKELPYGLYVEGTSDQNGAWLNLLYSNPDIDIENTYVAGSLLLPDSYNSESISTLDKIPKYREWMRDMGMLEGVSENRRRHARTLDPAAVAAVAEYQLDAATNELWMSMLCGKEVTKVWGPWDPKALDPVTEQDLLNAAYTHGFHIIHVHGSSTTTDHMYEALIDAMNEHFAYVTHPNIIIRRIRNESNQLIFDSMDKPKFISTYSALTFNHSDQVRDKNGNTCSKTKKAIMTRIWLDSVRKRQYLDFVFNPNPALDLEFKHHLNTWHGWRWSEEELRQYYTDWAHGYQADYSPIRFMQNHIYNVICRGDREKYLFLMCFICKKVREPWWKPETCFVITGHEGAGKSCFVEALLYMAHCYGLTCTDLDRMLGQFNNFFMDKMIIFLDEASYAGANKNNQQLKNWLTSDKLIAEKKFAEPREKKNYAMMVMATNDRVVVLQGRDCRRFALFDCADNRARGNILGHDQYFKLLHTIFTGRPGQQEEFMKDYFLKLWFAQFYQVDLYPASLLAYYGNYSYHSFPRSCITSLEEQKTYSLFTVAKFWKHCLVRGYSYLPALDYHLNSWKPDQQVPYPSDEYNTPELLKQVCLPEVGIGEYELGRVITDFHKNSYRGHPRMAALNKEDITMVHIMQIRNPCWLPGRAWLGVQNMKIAYEEYQKLIHNRIITASRDRHLMEQVDYPAFLSQTKECFGDAIKLYRCPVERSWIWRSVKRKMADTDLEWTMAIDQESGYSDEMSSLMIMGYLGTLREAQVAFYTQQGVDVTADKGIIRDDLLGTASMPNSVRGTFSVHEARFGLHSLEDMYAEAAAYSRQ